MNKLFLSMFVFIFGSQMLLAQGNLNINANAQMIMNGNVQFVCHEMKLNNNGTINTGTASNVVMISAASPGGVTIGGSTVTAFHKLEIQTVDPILLDNEIQINDSLNFTSGQLDLNGNQLNFGINGVISSEANGQSIIGAVGGTAVSSGDLNAPSGLNPGNLGMTITSSANLGNTTIRRGHVAPSSSDGGYGINRYYDITAANNSDLNATIRFSYLDSELNGLNENELELYRSTDGGTTWTRAGFDTRNTTENWVEKTGVDGFSVWALGSPTQNALPVGLSYFKASCNNGELVLNWATASETNNDRFEIEASNDGRRWETLSVLSGYGNSTETNFYNFSTSNYSGYTLFRLKQVDFDGSYAYSDVTFIDCSNGEKEFVHVFPNPTTNHFSIEIREAKDEVLNFELVNSLGQTIETRKVRTADGWTKQEFSLDDLPTGFYELVISGKTGTRTHKILKERE